MPLLKVRQKAQITLPADVRRAAGVRDGDMLQAEVVEGRIVLTPVTVSGKTASLARLKAAMASVRYVGAQPEPDEDELARLVAEDKAEYRRDRREDPAR